MDFIAAVMLMKIYCVSIMETHGGCIYREVEERCPGVGAAFVARSEACFCETELFSSCIPVKPGNRRKGV